MNSTSGRTTTSSSGPSFACPAARPRRRPPPRPGRADPAARPPRGARRPARRAGGGAVRLSHHLPGAHGPYDARLARAAAAGEPWGPLAEAYLARQFGEVFGEGSASYVEVRDEFSADEFSAWLPS